MSNSKSQSNRYVSEDKLMLRLDNILYEYYQDNGNQLLLNHIVLYNLGLDVREGEFVMPRVTPRPRNIDHPLMEYITKEIVAESGGQFPTITNTTTTTNNNKPGATFDDLSSSLSSSVEHNFATPLRLQ